MGSVSVPRNEPAPNTPYFTPIQNPPAGTALSANPPTLFTPLKIRDVTFQNRIWVAPMCMYSADNGHLTDFHLVHLSAFAYRGASLTIIEATSVLPNGRITPEDAGLWTDSQIAPIKRISTFLHSQGQKLGIQLAHAGRKASTCAPWLLERGKAITATEDVGGWPEDVMGASAIRWGEGYAMPREMSRGDIEDVVRGFKEAARRSVEAGVDVIEIHGAHGYLISSFLSPISNRRTDEYGGSFENRIRLLVEVINAIREVVPSGMPLLLRVSSTEWMEEQAKESWDVESTIRLAKLLPGLGVDLLDVSSGGNNEKQAVTPYNNYQVGIAGRIREELYKSGIKNLLIGAVGMITEAEAAKEIVEKGKGDGLVEIEDENGGIAKADIVLVARQFLREPEWVLRVAYRLGVKVQWPSQYSRGQFVKRSKI
ncbi:NADH-dependent flavin oxidoreductase-like protein [Hyaloscypha variabilis F]|uniref:NADH-dependent flavin oxidoreductase-like protein n=1 Tax=Hyaloscypha variabilis (strain UAMH 11265 / GT02V1 / F) TaxID=1149755 RepID=A0A2J6QYH0_HYAVF|nr:NADH-dependent flavin oxidoreductase-like protein [Hyaloscypha variabilis F]